jgi:hypothetical protein
MQPISITIGIKALNEERHIAASLASACAVADVVPWPVEVILADSGSRDATIAIARGFAPVRIVQLAHPEERCCGAGAQAAFQTATGRYFYLLDGDMEIDPAFIAAGVAFLEANPGHAGVGGVVREANTGSIEFAARARNDLVGGSSVSGDTDRLDCGGLYRVEAIRALGYFGDRNLSAFEEFDLAARLGAQGWKLARIAMPAVTHHGHDLPGLALIWRRIRSGYAGGTGQVVRAAWGRPHLGVVLRGFSHLRHAAVVVGWWLALLVVLALWAVTGRAGWGLGLAALVAAPIAFLSWRRGSVYFGVYSLATWLMHGVGLIQGLARPRCAPEVPIALVLLKEAEA